MFLLGGWIVCTLCVDAIAYMNLRLPADVMAGSPPAAEKIIKDYGADQAAVLLHYFAAEGNRRFSDRWETMEIILGLLLVPFVFFAADRRVVPLSLAGFMLVLALFQYFAVSPEVAYRGREADFAPGRGNVTTEQRAWTMTEVFIATEAAMVLSGGVLAFYVASYKSRRRVRPEKDVTPVKDIATWRV